MNVPPEIYTNVYTKYNNIQIAMKIPHIKKFPPLFPHINSENICTTNILNIEREKIA